VSPVRERERVIAFSAAAEPDNESLRGTDQRAESGGVSTGRLGYGVGGLQGAYYSKECAPGKAMDEHLADSTWAMP
jgi:hypothetical protein